MLIVAWRLGLIVFSKHWIRGCQGGAWCEDVVLRHQGQSRFRNSTSRVCLKVLLEGLKPRYPKKSIKSILTEPRWYTRTSPQPDL